MMLPSITRPKSTRKAARDAASLGSFSALRSFARIARGSVVVAEVRRELDVEDRDEIALQQGDRRRERVERRRYALGIVGDGFTELALERLHRRDRRLDRCDQLG